MGRSHASSGLLAWSAVTAVAHTEHLHPGWASIAAGTLATAGAALLPDLDHPEATIAWTFGPISRAAARATHRLSGGHRHATHSLSFAASLTALTWLGVRFGGRGFAAVLMFVLFAFAIRALRLAPGLVAAAAFLATCLFCVALRSVAWLPLSVGVGVLTHLIGDCLTREGCPLLWPNRRRFKLPVIRRTGNRVETMLFAPLFAVGAVALLAFGR
jgi:membrane-bound metal-dependent hydrolase YbcI (DUF457 family)